ncbi:MAG TPA: FtsX-like permease family protein, partial [Cyclobacteriaceae bacterium]|nr:FtsX-like permease family protein [Cyclobacteriaceae bacterium]
FRSQLINQYLSESVLTALIALFIGLSISWFAVEWLNSFTGKQLALDFSQWPLMLGLLTFAVVVGLLAGIYPALVVSGFKPALVLKGQLGSAKGRGGIRKTLVVVQFAISIALMIATATTFLQLEFMNNRPLGYDKDQVVVLRLFPEIASNFDSFHNELLKNSSIGSVGRSSMVPTDRLVDYDGAKVPSGDKMESTSVVIKNVGADYDYLTTFGVTFAAGRNFSREIKSDDSIAYILNESAVKMIGWTNDNAIGKDFQYGDRKGKVIGVVKDFHFESLHEPIVPVVFMPFTNYGTISVRIASKDMQQGIAHIEKVWKEFLPIRPFEYIFLSERYQQLYQSEQKQGQLFTVFSSLAIFIACLGLFGLATFSTLQRMKEVGIRKILGASTSSLLSLLSREIFILVLIANVIAWPAGWYFMRLWLDGFAYRIDMPVAVFVISTLAALMVALITVSSQTIRTAMTNPARTLRYE